MSGGRAQAPSPLWLIAPAAAAPLLLAAHSPVWRAAAGVVAVTVLPGALLVGLLETYRPLAGRRRAALVVPAGLAWTITLLLILDAMGRYSTQLAVALLILLEEGLAAAWLWRGRAPRPSGTGLRVPRGGGELALVAAALVFAGTVAYAAVKPGRTTSLTEFYLLGLDGRLPPSLDGDEVRVIVANHEGCDARYRLVGRGSAAGEGVPLGVAETSLPAGARWERGWALPAGVPLDRAVFTLFKDGDPRPYREVWVGAAGSSAEQLENAGGGDGEKDDAQWDDGDAQNAIGAGRPGGPDGGYDLADGEEHQQDQHGRQAGGPGGHGLN